MKTLRQIHDHFRQLATDGGLGSDQVLESRAALGANRLTPPEREPLWQRFLEKFDEPIIGILLAPRSSPRWWTCSRVVWPKGFGGLPW